LEPGEIVLDLGCGSLVVAAEVQRRAEVRIIGLETGNYRKRPLPMIIGAGQSAPFRARSFDTVLIGFVLHHCPDGGIAVLREAGRLARKKILLLEDRYDHLLEQVVARLADKFLNRLENPNVPVPYRFRSSEEWKELFRELDLELLAMEMVRTTPVLETRQVLFVLKP
jgi:ubiquinone/menaquinone biosynthesis C-methylase UbiE